MKYRAIVFDLFGTLIYNSTPTESDAVLARMASVLSVPADDLIRMWSTTTDARMTGVFADYKACIAHICRELGAPAKDREVEAAAAIRLEMTSGELSRPQPGAERVLARLKAIGYRTGLISDASFEACRLFTASLLSRLIDVTLFSCGEGISKQDQQIFERALERLGVPGEHCMYVGDGSGRELDNAAAAGMTPVLVRIPGGYGENPFHIKANSWEGLMLTSLDGLFGMLE